MPNDGKKIMKLTTLVLAMVLFSTSYLVQEKQLLTSVLHVGEIATTQTEEASTRIADIPQRNYERVEIVQHEITGNTISFAVKDQKIGGYTDSYQVECRNRDDEKDLLTARYGVPVLIVEGAQYGATYYCRVGIDRNGEVVAKSVRLTIQIADSPYQPVEIVDYETYTDKILVKVAEQVLEYGDLYQLRCESTVFAEEAFEENSEKPEVWLGNLQPDSGYQCAMAILRNGERVSAGNTQSIQTKMVENPLARPKQSVYPQVKIASVIEAIDNIEIEVEDLGLQYGDKYVAQCREKYSPENVYTENVRFPKIRLRGLKPETEYVCDVAVKVGEELTSQSEDFEVKTKGL